MPSTWRCTSKCCDTMNVFVQLQNRCMTLIKGALHRIIRRPGLCGMHSGGAFDIVATQGPVLLRGEGKYVGGGVCEE